MILKFLKNQERYEFTSGGYNNKPDQVKFDNPNIPAVPGGFIVINEETGAEFDYTRYTVVYEKTPEYIIFTEDENVYSTFYIFDPTTNYVTGIITTPESTMENAILKTKGQGKEYQFPKVEDKFYDEDGFPLYKAEGGKIVSVTLEDKQPWLDERAREAFESAKSGKLSEINAACESAIVKGVDYSGAHYSFTPNDQSNILNAVQLSLQTGLNIPYHADGEACRLFTKDEICGVYVANQTNLTHNTTYYNQLKMYVETLNNIEDIKKIEYGKTQLTGKYKETYDTVMAQAKQVIEKFIGLSNVDVM